MQPADYKFKLFTEKLTNSYMRIKRMIGRCTRCVGMPILEIIRTVFRNFASRIVTRLFRTLKTLDKQYSELFCKINNPTNRLIDKIMLLRDYLVYAFKYTT